MKISNEQRVALSVAHDADQKWRRTKAAARKEAERIVGEMIADAANERDKAVWAAHRLGAPKVVISRDALGTTSPTTVYEILARMEARDIIAQETVQKNHLVTVLAHEGFLVKDGNFLLGVVTYEVAGTEKPYRKAVKYKPDTREVQITNREGGEFVQNAVETYVRALDFDAIARGQGAPVVEAPVMVPVSSTESPAEDLYELAPLVEQTDSDDWVFEAPEGWDENDARSLDDIE